MKDQYNQSEVIDILKNYGHIKSDIHDLVKDFGEAYHEISELKNISFFPDFLKAIANEETTVESMNAAYIAVTSRSIIYITGRMLFIIKLKPEDFRRLLKSDSDLTSVTNKTENILEKSEALATQSEAYVTEEETGDLIQNYLNAIRCSQNLDIKIRSLGLEISQASDDDEQKERLIAELNENFLGIEEQAHEIVNSVPGKAKKFGADIIERVKNFGLELKGSTGRTIMKLKDTLKGIIGNIKEKLEKFFVELIGALFSFAAWLKKIALKKGFLMKELTLELPSFELSVNFVSKLASPKLIAKFIAE